MNEAERERIDQYVTCILCGLCYASCPARRKNDDFTGPAALAKLYRFLADSRDERSSETLAQENNGGRRVGLPHGDGMHQGVSETRAPGRRHSRRAARTVLRENRSAQEESAG